MRQSSVHHTAGSESGGGEECPSSKGKCGTYVRFMTQFDFRSSAPVVRPVEARPACRLFFGFLDRPPPKPSRAFRGGFGPDMLSNLIPTRRYRSRSFRTRISQVLVSQFRLSLSRNVLSVYLSPSPISHQSQQHDVGDQSVCRR